MEIGWTVYRFGPRDLYISAVSEDIRLILSETIVHQALSPTNRKQPAHGHISISGVIANMPCRVSLALACSLHLPSAEPKRLEIDPVMYRRFAKLQVCKLETDDAAYGQTFKKVRNR